MSSGGGSAGAGGIGFNDAVVILLLTAAVLIALAAVFGPTIGEIAKQINAAYQPVEQPAQVSGNAIAHAEARHGAEAVIARQCGERPDWVFINQATGRTAFGCWTDIGKIGIYIIERGGEEVTAFLKNKMKTADQFFQYMKNAGYELIQ